MNSAKDYQWQCAIKTHMLDHSSLTETNPTSVPTLGSMSRPSHAPSTVSTDVIESNNVEATNHILAVTIELLATMDASHQRDEAANGLARSICKLCAASRTLVLWRIRESEALQIIADSDIQSDDQTNGFQRLAIAAGEEIAVRGHVSRWPPTNAVDPQSLERHALMAVAQFGRELSANSVLGVPLPCEREDRGVLLVLSANDPRTHNLLLTIAAPVAGKLRSIERLQPTVLERTIRGIWNTLRSSSRNVVLLAVAVACLLMLVPVPYHVTAELELQPIRRRYIAVPFDGPLATAYVRPGDSVEQGQLLAKINPRELEYELAGLRAELNRAIQEKKSMMASHDFAGGKIASLEQERLRMQSDLLQYRHDHLEIRSPITGVVVSGDWKQSEGVPLSRGETLFEIAPLERMLVELSIDESDVGHVRHGMDVEFFVHAIPNRTMRAKISRVHPSAELRNQNNVFVGEVTIDDSENVLRPGMRGRARISSDRHPLGWNLFHKAYYAVRRSVGW